MKSIRDTYINVLWWMIEDLKLTGNKLLLYAIIYWYSQDGENVYRGSLSYIQKALWISRPTVVSLLKTLQEEWLIIKNITSKESLPSEWRASKETLLVGGKETLLVSGKETLPNIYNTTNNNTNNISKDISLSDDVKKEALEVYNYYIKNVSLYWPYNLKYNKKSLALERISNLILKKNLTKDDLLSIISFYIKEQKESIKGWYVKMVQYFFWPVERGSKIGYWEDYNPSKEEREEEKERKEKVYWVEDLFF